jgi:hypothetical protein
MNNYHASFSIRGEVTELLIVQKPVFRLMVDISAHPEDNQDNIDFLFRTSFSVIDPIIIAELQDQVSTGDVIEAKGSFWQTGYVPHQQGYIDTTFCLTGFRLIEKRLNSAIRQNPYHGLLPNMFVH